MPTDHILALLIAERDKLNRAIDALQGPVKRRGRSPKNPATPSAVLVTADTLSAPIPKKKRPRWTAAKRKAAAERAKAVWVRRRKDAGKGVKKT
jgi:hypothetical protein